MFDVDRELTRISHYVLLQRVGEGGMGVVYAAYDEVLDRKVAIKLLRVRADGAPRLLREAQALARLSHPNVVQVYEANEVGGAAFIAMEFVEGHTLGAWLRKAKRTRAEILEVFAAAGRGLVAAHDKGLVHRDFKPENVMVSLDHRVVVMDFGLARGRDLSDEIEPSSAAISGRDSRSNTLTSSSVLTPSGAVMGTPAYMSPEQYAGAGTSPATDQFGFSVALWEALCGQRPFAGRSLFVLQEAIRNRNYSEPEASELPSWLRRVLERGLSPDPKDRWPTMTAMLAALADDPTRRRRWLSAIVATLVVVVGGGGWAFEALERQRARAQAEARAEQRAACEQAGQALSGAWNETTRARLAKAFAGTKRGASGDAWLHTAARLDEYARQWSALRERVCVDVEVEATRDEDWATRVLRCLGEDRTMFEALLEVLGQQVDDEMVSRAPEAAAELPLASMCTNEAWLAQQIPPPEDEATRAAVVDLRARLERVAARQLAADYTVAMVEAEAVLAEAEALGWLPLEVEARMAVGDLQDKRGLLEQSRDSLRRAFFDAGHAGHDLVALDAASKLSWTYGVGLLDYEQGRLWADIGAMFVERMDLGGTVHEAKLLHVTAAVQYREGDNVDALVNNQRGYEIRRAEFGVEHPLVAASLNNIGLLQTSVGNYAEALASLRAGLEIRIRTLGPQHPSVAGSLTNIALALEGQGEYAAALTTSRQALAILEDALGPDHPLVGTSLNNVGVIQNHLGEFEDALASHRRGLAIKLAAYGPNHATIATSLANLGEAERGLGQLDAARDSLEAAFAVRDEAARMPAQRGDHAFSLALVLDELGEHQRAVELARTAIAAFVEAGEGEAGKRATVERWLAEREAETEKPDENPCCKTCGPDSIACGDSCISSSKSCHKAPGCACEK